MKHHFSKWKSCVWRVFIVKKREFKKGLVENTEEKHEEPILKPYTNLEVVVL
jgi:hypothetical protein